MKKIRYAFVLIFGVIGCLDLYGQRQVEIFLWPKGAPGANVQGGKEIITVHEQTGDHLVSNVHNPSITPFIPSPDKSKGIAVIIAPGGGHREIWIDHEGYNIAQRLAENGIAAFVLKYRLSRDKNSVYSVEAHSVKDMLRAVRVVRSRASEWKIDAHKIGVMGFSAGGQVAAMSDILADTGHVASDDPIEIINSKPDFQALIYPAWVNDVPVSKKS